MISAQEASAEQISKEITAKVGEIQQLLQNKLTKPAPKDVVMAVIGIGSLILLTYWLAKRRVKKGS